MTLVGLSVDDGGITFLTGVEEKQIQTKVLELATDFSSYTPYKRVAWSATTCFLHLPRVSDPLTAPFLPFRCWADRHDATKSNLCPLWVFLRSGLAVPEEVARKPLPQKVSALDSGVSLSLSPRWSREYLPFFRGQDAADLWPTRRALGGALRLAWISQCGFIFLFYMCMQMEHFDVTVLQKWIWLRESTVFHYYCNLNVNGNVLSSCLCVVHYLWVVRVIALSSLIYACYYAQVVFIIVFLSLRKTENNNWMYTSQTSIELPRGAT